MGKRLRGEMMISELQLLLRAKKSITDSVFALRLLMEKYRESQRKLHCASVDLQIRDRL